MANSVGQKFKNDRSQRRSATTGRRAAQKENAVQRLPTNPLSHKVVAPLIRAQRAHVWSPATSWRGSASIGRRAAQKENAVQRLPTNPLSHKVAAPLIRAQRAHVWSPATSQWGSASIGRRATRRKRSKPPRSPAVATFDQASSSLISRITSSHCTKSKARTFQVNALIFNRP